MPFMPLVPLKWLWPGLISQIPVDEVIEAMDRIGRALPSTLRETSEGGLATTETGRRIAKQLAEM